MDDESELKAGTDHLNWTALDLINQVAALGAEFRATFRDDDDQPIGLVLAVVGNPEYIQALSDMIKLVGANHNVQIAHKQSVDLGVSPRQEKS